MERLDAHIRALDGALEQGPEVFNPVRRDVPPDRLISGMADDLMQGVVFQTDIAAVLIGVECAARRCPLAYFPVQRLPIRS